MQMPFLLLLLHVDVADWPMGLGASPSMAWQSEEVPCK